MRLLGTILKYLGAFFIYAAAIAGFWFAALGAVVICKDQDWTEPLGEGYGTGFILLALAVAVPVMLLGFYIAQLVLWGVRGKIIPLRSRLGLDIFFGLSFSLAACHAYQRFLPVVFWLLLSPVVALCLGDLLMTAYVRWVDPKALVRPAALSRKHKLGVAFMLAAGVCLLLLGVAHFPPTQKSVEEMTDQARLARIAVEDKDDAVRYAAIGRLDDQALLAKIAFEDEDLQNRYCAVWRLKDQALLAKIAAESGDANVTKSATEKLARLKHVQEMTDQTELVMLVDDRDCAIRFVVVQKLTDQAMLADIAVTDDDDQIRLCAVEHLKDRRLLSKVAAEATDADVRRAASKKLAP